MSSTTKKQRHIPFEFVLDYLHPREPILKPMFGTTAVYLDNKIIFILRDKKEFPEDNGVWIATTREHHKSLKKDFPLMRSIKVFESDVTNWQVLPSSANDFETSVIRACEFVLKGDVRIGRIPKSKSKLQKQ